jgi:hypothetical protein
MPRAERQLFTVGSRAFILAAAVGLAVAYGAGVAGLFGWVPSFGAVRYGVLGGAVALVSSAAYLASEFRRLSLQDRDNNSIQRNQ